MYISFKTQTCYLVAGLLCMATTFFAQSNTAEQNTADTPTKTRLQHSIASNTFLGLQYDVRFRTPDKVTDFYVAGQINPFGNYRHYGLQAGVLFGNWRGFSVGAGVSQIFYATDYVTRSDNAALGKQNILFGLPLGIRYQPAYRSFFAQVNYMPVFNMTDGYTTAAYPQIQLGFSFGGKNPKAARDTTAIPKGVQHSAYVQAGSLGWGLAYDARFRTKIKWLDWATNASVGFMKSEQRTFDKFIAPAYTQFGTSLGVSALFGKRAFSFELGVQPVFSHTETARNTYVDYKTGELGWTDVVYESITIEGLIGIRYQNPKGGISGFANFGLGPAFDTFSSNVGSNASIRLGLGYSLKTR
jgi:hypothetical protein